MRNGAGRGDKPPGLSVDQSPWAKRQPWGAIWWFFHATGQRPIPRTWRQTFWFVGRTAASSALNKSGPIEAANADAWKGSPTQIHPKGSPWVRLGRPSLVLFQAPNDTCLVIPALRRALHNLACETSQRTPYVTTLDVRSSRTGESNPPMRHRSQWPVRD